MRRQLVIPILAALVWAVATASAAAHTTLVAASPEPKSTVGETIDAIELRFNLDVAEVVRFTVEAPGGVAVSGTRPSTPKEPTT